MKVLAASLILGAATLSPAGAPTAAASTATFSGSCMLSGVDVFSPPLTLTPRPTTAVADVSGTCNGAPARLHLATSGQALSCAGGSLTGTATLTAGATTVVLSVNEPQLTAASLLLMRGQHTGSAIGLAAANADTDLLGTSVACTGSGVRSVPITLSLTTLSPVG
jgi:hypothetical protein